MAVAAADLKNPKGPVTPAMFPGVMSNVLDANLELYIDRAEADQRIIGDSDQSKTDVRVRALALYYVFHDVYVDMNAKPLQLAQTDKGSHGFSVEQIRNMRVLAEGYLEEFLGLLTPTAGSAILGRTTAVPNKYAF